MGASSGSEPGPVADWRVRGSYFEGCNCEAICPCRSVGGRPGGPSSFGECFGALSWHIHEGHADGVDLSALRTVMSLRYFDRVQPSTPWEVVLYVDEGAGDEQRSALADIFLGRAGGTVARLYGPAIGEVHAVRPARITLEHVAARKRIDVVGYLHGRGRGRRLRAGRRPVRHPRLRPSRYRAARRRAASRPTRRCAGRSGDGATPPSPPTSTTAPTSDPDHRRGPSPVGALAAGPGRRAYALGWGSGS